MIHRLTHIRLCVPAAQMEACHLFYRDTLGFPCRFDELGAYMEYDAGDVVLALFRQDLMSAAVGSLDLPPAAASQDQVVLCLEVEDVDAAWTHLTERGAHPVKPPHNQPDWMLRVAFLRDPAGNLVEINRDL